MIGCSAGGHTAVKEVIRGLSDDLPTAVIVIRHMPALARSQYGTTHDEDWLRDVTRARVRLITEGDYLESGVIYLTPGGMSATIERQRFKLAPCPQKPAPSVVINALFESAAREYGNRIIGVILTGMLVDGTIGLRAVHEAGGLTVVQNPPTRNIPVCRAVQ
ncbi:MAG: chemotaxis protein CheB [Nitrospira sp.]